LLIPVMKPTPEDLANLDLTRALEDLAAPAYVIDREGRFRWLNRAYVELFGDRRGKPFADLVAPEHRQLARTNFARKLVGHTTRIFDLTVVDRTGERLTLKITSAPLRRQEEIVGIVGIGFPLPRATAPSPSVLDGLTPRQQEVLRLLAEGLETPAIARRLGVAEETARNHIRALLRSTGAHSRLEVVLLGLKHGVVAPNLTLPGQQGTQPPADD
jgi:PAS domain S-box-containing protein